MRVVGTGRKSAVDQRRVGGALSSSPARVDGALSFCLRTAHGTRQLAIANVAAGASLTTNAAALDLSRIPSTLIGSRKAETFRLRVDAHPIAFLTRVVTGEQIAGVFQSPVDRTHVLTRHHDVRIAIGCKADGTRYEMLMDAVHFCAFDSVSARFVLNAVYASAAVRTVVVLAIANVVVLDETERIGTVSTFAVMRSSRLTRVDGDDVAVRVVRRARFASPLHVDGARFGDRRTDDARRFSVLFIGERTGQIAAEELGDFPVVRVGRLAKERLLGIAVQTDVLADVIVVPIGGDVSVVFLFPSRRASISSFREKIEEKRNSYG